MKKMVSTGFVAFAATVSAAALAAVDPGKDVWMIADFDSPIRIQGKIYDQRMNPEGLAEGRFGRGYDFFRETNNKLPAMEKFLADTSAFKGAGLSVKNGVLQFAGGTFQTVPRPTSISYDHVGNDEGDTWSVYVRGQPGTSVTVWPEVSALAEKDKIKNPYPDSSVTNTLKLSGTGWQRIDCHARMDSRTANKRQIALWVKSDGPIELERFQLQTTGVHPAKGLFHPGRWVDGGQRTQSTILSCADMAIIKTFPYRGGACAFWMRTPAGVPANVPLNFWSLNGWWTGPQWGLSGGFFKAGQGGDGLSCKQGPSRKTTWTHIAVVWSEDRFAYFVDGVCTDERKADAKSGKKLACVPQKDGRGTLRIGTFTEGNGPTDVVLDDFAIFNRPLTDGEIRELAAAKKGLYADRALVLTDDPEFHTFYRDAKPAILHHAVWASQAGDYRLDFVLDGVRAPVRTVALQAGYGTLELPFTPSDVLPGVYDYSFKLTAKDDTVALNYAGKLNVRPHLDAHAFLYHSWGGVKPVGLAFGDQVGINCYNVSSGERLRIRELAEKGYYESIRYSNGDAWKKTNFDGQAIRAQATDDLAFARYLPTWKMMLLNSEIYSVSWAHQAQDFPKYRALAKAAIGLEPQFGFTDDTEEIRTNRVKGVIGHRDSATLETLKWVIDKGMPPYLSNRETTEAVHALKPDVTVWSEPLYAFHGLADTVDMGADWIYQYSTITTLAELRSMYAGCRAFGKPFMPTLGGCYWPTINGEHPVLKKKDGKPQTMKMAQGADEVAIKTWMAIGAVPAHALSFYELDTWEYGVTNALRFAAAKTNTLEMIGEPDVGERYGRAWRQELQPAAELLRDLPNARAKVALLFLPESKLAGGYWWGHHWYSLAIMSAFASQAPAYDYIRGDEATADLLAQYKYVFLPMANVIYRDRVAMLNEVARRGVTIVQDAYATNHFPNEVYLKNVQYRVGENARMQKDILAWYQPHVDELKGFADAVSTCDGTNGFTFVKSYKGARYVVVVNDRRDPKPSFLNTFKTNDWYRVRGEAQRIETAIRNVPADGEVCLFNAHGRRPQQTRRGNEVVCADTFAPAEGRVYCVYPRPLEAPELELEGEAKAGGKVTLVVRISDDRGHPAPGRQLIALKLSDGEGRVRDESGRYLVEDGIARIGIGFLRNERPAGFFSRWCAEVTDLTTGRAATLKFRVSGL